MDTIAAHGGLSYSNNYDVEWVFPVGKTSEEGNATENKLVTRLNDFGFDLGLGGSTTKVGDQEGIVGGNILKTDVNSKGMVIKYFCDEAQLPNVSSATGQMTGRFLGEGQVSYPHTRIFTDFQLGWICDADMTPLKFLNLWYGTIFNEYNYAQEAQGGATIGPIEPTNNKGESLSSQKDKAGEGNAIANHRSVRLSYPESYLAKCIITKTEKGAFGANSRASMSYTLLDCYPYSIDSVPLSAGASQATKVTANFYYSKHVVTYNDISKANL